MHRSRDFVNLHSVGRPFNDLLFGIIQGIQKGLCYVLTLSEYKNLIDCNHHASQEGKRGVEEGEEREEGEEGEEEEEGEEGEERKEGEKREERVKAAGEYTAPSIFLSITDPTTSQPDSGLSIPPPVLSSRYR